MSDIAYPITEAGCVRRATNKGKGRTQWLAPGDGAVKHLHYGRIILDRAMLRWNSPQPTTRPASSACAGSARIAAESQSFHLAPYDAIYVPRDAARHGRRPAPKAAIWPKISAPVNRRHIRCSLFPIAKVRNDPALHFPPAESSTRDLNILIGKNVQAGRIVAGVTFSRARQLDVLASP